MTDLISFPGLGLEFEINRVAFSIGSVDIYWYAILIATGFLLAMLFAFKNAKRFGIDGDRIVDVIFFAMILGIIGARAYYVAFQWDMYKDNLAEILNIRGGGLGFYGGIIGGVLGLIVGCKLRGQKILPFLWLRRAACIQQRPLPARGAVV
jgi:phosphatidylglycerol:prolipoprotein diacylglycerol transferase